MKKPLLLIVCVLTCLNSFAAGNATATEKAAATAGTTDETPDFSMRGFATVNGEGITTTTGGAGGTIITIRTLAELETWAASRERKSTPEIVHIIGKITAPSSQIVTIKDGANISILGVGTTAELENVGLVIRKYKNVIVRNLKIHEVFYPNDALTIDECQHVWVDHNEFHSKIGAGIGVDTYDGLLDIKNGARYVTVSWNYFHDHMKNVLIGHTDNANSEATDREIRVTFHHNFFENTDGRNPSLRWGAVHLFNNYFKNITDYGLAARQGARALVEHNIYENVKLPLTTNKFDGEGYICERGNVFTGTSGNNAITRNGCDWWTETTLPYTYTLSPTADLATTVPANVGVGKVNVTGNAETVTYRLTTATVGEGSINTAGGLYTDGETVSLTATPASGWRFSGWSGDASGTTNPLVLPMDNNKTITATFVAEGTGTAGPTVRISATDTPANGLCSFDGATRLVDAANGSVINLPNTAAKGITWKVEVPVAGNYELKWHYAGGGSAAVTTAKLLVNGTSVNDEVDFPKPKDSKTFLETAPLSVALGLGVNEIRIETTQDAAFADIGSLIVTGEAPVAADCVHPVGYQSTVTSAGKNLAAAGAVRVYPNPTSGSFQVELNLEKRQHVKVVLYTLSGASVAVVTDALLEAGVNTISYSGPFLKPGLYLYVVETEKQVHRLKLSVR